MKAGLLLFQRDTVLTTDHLLLLEQMVTGGVHRIIGLGTYGVTVQILTGILVQGHMASLSDA